MSLGTKFLNCLLFGLLTFGAVVAPLHAESHAEKTREEQLQAVFSHFPLLSPTPNGKAQFQTLPLRNPVVIDGTNYYGFRFTVPPQSHHEDFVWGALLPIVDYIEWDLVPEHGSPLNLDRFFRVENRKYWGNTNLLPADQNWMMLQGVPGNRLEDNKTYLMWLSYEGAEQDISVTFTFAPLGTNGTNRKLLMERTLGLTERVSQMIENPLNHHKYALLAPSTWQNAEAQAVIMGGHLATVRNQAENDWILKTFGNRGGRPHLLWIGLSDRDKKFHFTWSSGESASYTSWARGEPNNAGRGEDFVAIYYPTHIEGGKWNDWDDRIRDPIGLPMQGVVEIIPPEQPAAVTLAKSAPNAADETQTVPSVQILPQVVITSEGGAIKLRWPPANAHFMLEAATNINGPFTMFGYSELTNAEDGMIYVTITNPAPQMFFRLRQP